MKKSLREKFDGVVQEYVAALLKMYDWDGFYGYWVSDDTTGVYAYGDSHFLNLETLIFIVDNKVPEDVLEQWEEYCLWALEFNQSTPNLSSWVNGCPRVSEKERERLTGLKSELEEEVVRMRERSMK